MTQVIVMMVLACIAVGPYMVFDIHKMQRRTAEKFVGASLLSIFILLLIQLFPNHWYYALVLGIGYLFPHRVIVIPLQAFFRLVKREKQKAGK